MFFLPIAIPISCVLCAAGVLFSLLLSPQESTDVAFNIIPSAQRAAYGDALAIIQGECYKSLPPGRECFEDQPPKSAKAVSVLFGIAAKSGLRDCKSTPLPATRSFSYDYLTCTSPKSPPVQLFLFWLLLVAVGAGQLFKLAGAMPSSRNLMPRFSPNLWIVPNALGAFVAFLAPLAASVVTFYHRLNEGNPDFWPQVSLVVAWGIWAVSISAAIVAVDLRMFAPDRIFSRGLSALFVGFLIQAIIFQLTASRAPDARLGFALSAELLVVAIFLYLGRRWWRDSALKFAVAAMRIFLLKLLKLVWPLLAMGSALTVRSLTTLTAGGKSPLVLAWAIWVAFVLWTRKAEQLIQ